MNIFNINTPRHICFIVGPYKTGTSLVAKYLERNGYFNPYFDDNIYDIAVGLTAKRYKTRESRSVREINLQILQDDGCGLYGKFSQKTIHCKKYIFLNVVNYLNNCRGKTVLKDPLFCWTLPIWIDGCRLISCPLQVIFTERTHGTKEAWKNAPFTRELVKYSLNIIDRMSENVISNTNLIRSMNIPYFKSCYIPPIHIEQQANLPNFIYSHFNSIQITKK